MDEGHFGRDRGGAPVCQSRRAPRFSIVGGDVKPAKLPPSSFSTLSSPSSNGAHIWHSAPVEVASLLVFDVQPLLLGFFEQPPGGVTLDVGVDNGHHLHKQGGGGGGGVSMNSSSPQLLCTQPAATAPCSPSCSLQVDPPPPPPPPPPQKKKTPAAARPLHPRSLPRANAQGVRARLAHLAATRGQVLLHARWRGEVGFVPSEVTLACWCGGGGGGRRTISECRRWASSQVPHAYSWCGGVGVGGRRGGGGGARGASSHACLSAACLP